MKLTLHTRLLLLAAATALLAAPGAAHARAAKAPAPPLSIDSKVCKTGEAVTDRYAVVTATALLPASADRVGLRFAMQQKNIRGKWVNVPDIGGTLGSWELSAPGRDGLRFTKTIDGLAEGTNYRVAVQARGVDAAGKVSTATARRFVPCNQPQITPHVAITRLLRGDDPAVPKLIAPIKADAGLLVIVLRNTGRSDSGPIEVTLRNAATGELFAKIGSAGLKPKRSYPITTGLPTCTGKVEVSVRDTSRPTEVTTPDQIATIPCAKPATTQRAR